MRRRFQLNSSALTLCSPLHSVRRRGGRTFWAPFETGALRPPQGERVKYTLRDRNIDATQITYFIMGC